VHSQILLFKEVINRTDVTTYIGTNYFSLAFLALLSNQSTKSLLLYNPKIHQCVHKSLPLNCILSQFNPVYFSTPAICKIYFKSSSHLNLGLPNVSLLGSCNQHSSTCMSHPAHLILLDLIPSPILVKSTNSELLIK